MKMNVPYVVFPQQVAKIKSELMDAFESVLESGMYVMGEQMVQFEEAFAQYCGTTYGAGVSNGTTGLYMVMYNMCIGPGDEVITAPNSFIASAGSIGVLGARPVFVDVCEDLNIDPEKIEEAITPKTKAIMPVHLTGRPAKMNEINAIAKRHGLVVIEDAAQSVGAKYRGKRVGSLGDVACFSLHPLKNLHAFGDGGAVTTSDSKIYNDILMARNHGLKNRNESEFWSLNFRLDEIQAAMLMVQLPLLDQWTATRRERAMRYNRLLSTYADTPEENEGEFCVWQTYVVKVERRDELLQYLQANGVQANIHYPIPLHVQKPAQYYGYKSEDFPVAMSLSRRILSLPLYPEMTDDQQDYVVDLFRKFYGS